MPAYLPRLTNNKKCSIQLKVGTTAVGVSATKLSVNDPTGLRHFRLSPSNKCTAILIIFVTFLRSFRKFLNRIITDTSPQSGVRLRDGSAGELPGTLRSHWNDRKYGGSILKLPHAK